MTRILIIEDEGSYREALTFMLGKEGFDVAARRTGRAAWPSTSATARIWCCWT